MKVTSTYGGAKVVADDREKTYIGELSDEFSQESIFNDYGNYRSKYGDSSIWNEHGDFGGEYSSRSPFNKFALTAPFIVKDGKVIGRLTVNRLISGAVDPHWLNRPLKNG